MDKDPLTVGQRAIYETERRDALKPIGAAPDHQSRVEALLNVIAREMIRIRVVLETTAAEPGVDTKGLPD